ncbi:response regulator [Litorisediminicola beolgyonensis]|uniref:histidine kinase n=1 Tax=Litorisediminicola beolgyonensis TaxID=1173614 RepID=A0ABW3ZEG2_9RHOB
MPTGPRSLPRPLILASVTVLCVMGIGILVEDVRTELKLLNSATSDNAQWTLSQADVEFLELQGAVDDLAYGDERAIAQSRLEFDIFYSRIAMLSRSSLYGELLDQRDYASALSTISASLDEIAQLIDQPDSALVADAAALQQSVDALRPAVRELTTSGLAQITALSDARRHSFADTLYRLAMVLTVFVLALALMAIYSSAKSRETRRRELELGSAYARLNTVIGTSLDGVIVTDMSGSILDFNPAAEQIFRRRAQDVLCQPIGDVIVPPHLRAAHNAGMARMAQNGEMRVVGQGRVQLEGMRSDGSLFPVELALQTAEAEGTRLIVAFLRDISAQVAAEQALVDARDHALAGEKAKSDFLAVMTHEIRTPLNGVLGFLGLLKNTPLSAKQEDYVKKMAISGDILMQHVDSVLDIARIETGKMRFTQERVHLGQLVKDLVDSQTSAAARNGNTLSWVWVGEPLDWIWIDPMRLKQILLNIVGNAIKFTRNGTISVELEQELTDAPNPVVMFRVIDTGTGIGEDEQERIFEDFHTSDTGFDRAVGGTGLGLGIAKRLVDALGGEIGVESDPGEGSVFWVQLPVREAAAPQTPVVDRRAQPRSEARKILVVEDNEINRHLVRETLEGFGHRVWEVENGEDAIEIAGRERFDLILMDISMPVMDGLQATRRIREDHGASYNVPIIALSANVLPEAQKRFIEAGMTAYIGKPFEQDELRALIARYTEDAGDPVSVSDAAPDPREKIRAKFHAAFQKELIEFSDWLAGEPEDLEEVAFRSHKLAGGAGAFEAHELREALVSVEEAARSGDRQAIVDRVAAALPLIASETAR